MKTFKLPLLLMTCLLAGPSFAKEDRASDASIRELLAVSKSRELIDGSYVQLEKVLSDSFRAEYPNMNAAQLEVVDEMNARLTAIIKEEWRWEVIEKEFVAIYQKSLSQSEVDGIVQFYRTDAGKAWISKMPAIMQETMVVMTGLSRKLAPRMSALKTEFAEKLEAAGK